MRTNANDPMEQPNIISPISKWLEDQKKLKELQVQYEEYQRGLTDLASQIRTTMESLNSYNPRLAQTPEVKPKRVVDPTNGRPFAISTGRTITEAKKAGKTENEARDLAMSALTRLTSNEFYNMPKPPKAAVDRIEVQLAEQYHSEDE